MAELAVYYARAMDDRAPVDIHTDDENISRLLREINGVIINPYHRPVQNILQDSFDLAESNSKLLKTSDVVLVNLSVPGYQYVGCIFEVVDAVTNGIPVVLIDGASDYHQRVYFQSYCDFLTKDAGEAVEYIRRVYTKAGLENQLAEMKSYYARIAPEYMAASVQPDTDCRESAESFALEREELRSVISRHARGRACELGVGAGDWTKTLCESAREVVAIEASAEMLEQARENLSAFKNIRFLHRDALEEIPDGPFDCVVVYFLLSLFPEPIQARLLNSLRKVIKPGGLLLIADSKKLRNVESAGLGRRQLQRRRLDDRTFTLYKEHFVGETLQRLLEKYGFCVIESNKQLDWFSWAVARNHSALP